MAKRETNTVEDSIFPVCHKGEYGGLRAREALIKASLPNFNFYWLGKWPPQ
jgi:hypothetical protein